MKKETIFCLMFVFIFLSAQSWAVQENTTTYVNNDMGFTIEHPSSWKNTHVEGGNIVVLFMGGAMNRNIQVMYDKGGEEAGTAALQKLAEILGTQKELSAEWKDINGRRSFLQEVEWTSMIGSNWAVRLMVPKEDHFFLVMGVCPSREVDDLGPLIRQCVLSFQVTR